MGCSSSKQTTVAANGNKPQSAHNQDQANTKMVPTAQDLQLVKETWALVALDLKKHGTTLFLRLFEQHPNVQPLFEKIKDVPHDQLATNEHFSFHAVRVMETIDHAIRALSDLPALVEVLKHLGASHAQYNIKKEYFKPVGDALIYTMEQGLGDKFTAEAKTAWIKLYGVIVDNMSQGLDAASDQ